MSGWDREKQQREDMNKQRLLDEEKVRKWFEKKAEIERQIRERQREADAELRRLAEERARQDNNSGKWSWGKK